MNPAAVGGHFALDGDVASVAPHGEGNIHESWLVSTATGTRYLLQRLNTTVFGDPAALMANIAVVTEHVRGPLTIVPTNDGRTWWDGGSAGAWRVYGFVDGAHSLPVVSSVSEAGEAARAVGAFHRSTGDLDPARLHVTLPRFHDPALRFEAFTDAIDRDHARRLDHRSVLDLVPRLPTRVTHNDAKLDNVLFDDATGRAIGLVDLDTVMPGSVVWDVGDLLRTVTCPAREDELDLTRVAFNDDWFDVALDAYLAEAGPVLTPDEIEAVPVAGVVMAFEQALRFLTDHLAGDVYYRIRTPEQNLHRARTQLRLLDAMLACQHRHR